MENKIWAQGLALDSSTQRLKKSPHGDYSNLTSHYLPLTQAKLLIWLLSCFLSNWCPQFVLHSRVYCIHKDPYTIKEKRTSPSFPPSKTLNHFKHITNHKQMPNILTHFHELNSCPLPCFIKFYASFYSLKIMWGLP